MQNEQFNFHVSEQIERCRKTLVQKADEYAGDDDRIHNFRVAAKLRGETHAQAALGMMSKHIVSVYDMVESGNSYPAEMWDEKIGDALNYLLIIRAIVADENTLPTN